MTGGRSKALRQQSRNPHKEDELIRNSLTDLKNYLFEQIERVNDNNLTDEELDKEIKRSKAVTEASRTIVEIAKLSIATRNAKNRRKEARKNEKG